MVGMQWRRIAIGAGLGLVTAAGVLLLSSAPAAADDGLLPSAAHSLVRPLGNLLAPLAEPAAARPASTAGRPITTTGTRSASARSDTPPRRAGKAIRPPLSRVTAKVVASAAVESAGSRVVRAVATTLVAPAASTVRPAHGLVTPVFAPVLDPVVGPAVVDPVQRPADLPANPPQVSEGAGSANDGAVSSAPGTIGSTGATVVARDEWAATAGASLPGPARPAGPVSPAPHQAMAAGAGSPTLAATVGTLPARPAAGFATALRRTADAPLEAASAPDTRPG